jgi:hypothetical protein
MRNEKVRENPEMWRNFEGVCSQRIFGTGRVDMQQS